MNSNNQQNFPPTNDTSLLGKRALVVDDDPQFLKFLVNLLDHNGIFSIAASNGHEALTALSSNPVDFILSDVQMPEMDGYEFLSAVRSNPRYQLLPFILLTGKPAYTGLQLGIRRGADGYLPKPFDEQTLLDTVRGCLARVQTIAAQANSKLNELRANLLTMLPHELHTPLNGIFGVADLLEMGDATPEELADCAQILRSSGERMLRLSTNFLLCAELQLQENHPEKTTLLFGSQPNSDTSSIPPILEKRATSWSRLSDLTHNIPYAQLAIPTPALIKIVDELTDNAFKFSAPGQKVEVIGSLQNNYFHLQFIDHGHTGTRAQTLSTRGIFVQFNRNKLEQQGAGLGIYLAEKLLNLYNVAISFSDTPNGGITANVLIPLSYPS
ncbi:MAG: hybrid sensor histidine kinase/response regulator [Chthoniobacterales bacterium]|nr:hybrid sensor histidine kinase/response regulator [Chthoniobacterales bacterium]